MKQDKEIIGYKLIKQEYEKAAIAIVDSSVGLWNDDRINFSPNDTWYNKFKNAGVLDIWFTPIYKEEPKFKEGKWYRYTEGQGWALRCCTTSSDKLEFDSYIRFSPKEFCKTSTKCSYFFNSPYLTNLEVPLSEIQQYLPDGHPDKIAKEFVLPEKWYIECNEENRTTLNTYFHTIGNSYIGYSSDRWSVVVSYCYMYPQLTPKSWGTQRKDLADYTEITFEQFKKYVLKEVDWTKATKEELLAEAKRRYPVGTRFVIPASLRSDRVESIITVNGFILGCNNNIYGSAYVMWEDHDACVYFNGKWAEIIEQPKKAPYTPGMRTPDIGPYYGKEELVWVDSNRKPCKISELSKIHLSNIIKVLKGQGIKNVTDPYNGKTKKEWLTIMQEEYDRRFVKTVSTELFSKEQLEAINKMIDDKVKELQ